jgi:IS1 family transposase
MANVLPTEKQAMVISALCEGASMCAVSRMTGIHGDTISRLSVRIGNACASMMDEVMRELPCARLEIDELWTYVGKHQKFVTESDKPEAGDAWIYTALCPDTKAVPCFRVGKRTQEATNAFVSDIAGRMTNRINLSSDGLSMYPPAVEAAFGGEVNYGQIVKSYEASSTEGRYMPPRVESVKRTNLIGEAFRVGTSYVERQNCTARQHVNRLTRLTLGFSKKLENLNAAMGLYFAYYNFVRRHKTIRCTPAMELGVASRLWKVEDLVALAAK